MRPPVPTDAQSRDTSLWIPSSFAGLPCHRAGAGLFRFWWVLRVGSVRKGLGAQETPVVPGVAAQV